MNKKIVILIAKSVAFYSHQDEEAFLNWIKAIKSIKMIDYQGSEMHIYIKSNRISDKDLNNLLALFFRYKIKMNQLSVFLNDANKEWFFDQSKMYWHKKIFSKNN